MKRSEGRISNLSEGYIFFASSHRRGISSLVVMKTEMKMRQGSIIGVASWLNMVWWYNVSDFPRNQ